MLSGWGSYVMSVTKNIYQKGEDIQKYLRKNVEVPKKFALLVGTLIVLNILDLLTTLYVVETMGSQVEANPLMKVFLDTSPELFSLFKTGVLFIIIIYYVSKKSLIKRDYVFFICFNILFLIITINNLIGCYIVTTL